eukprot:NODE_4329_length_685_cov_145.187302.p2 GENE.NODE_4329_length_685_cov_145.187302~~NODE_4329_length_685_cov_145.187302.p2  ORF type:complete len:175 (+),score=49.78 NODE_4329_length_685_cov_145.187302:73-597(+)
MGEGFIYGVEIPWYKLFVAFDRDQDGVLTVCEFEGSLWTAMIGFDSVLSRRDVEALIAVLDVDGSGAIEWSKFVMLPLVLTRRLASRLSPEPLCTAYRIMERSFGVGFGTVTALYALLERADGDLPLRAASVGAAGPLRKTLDLPDRNLRDLLRRLGRADTREGMRDDWCLLDI